MDMYWILVADAGSAKLFAKRNRMEKMMLVKSFDENAPQKRKPHQTSNKINHKRNLLVDNEQHVNFFARSLAEELYKGYYQDSYHRLILITPPRFHGMVKKYLNKQVHRRLSAVLEKNYTRLNEQKIEKQIRHQVFYG